MSRARSTGTAGFDSLEAVRPLYFLPADDLAFEVLIPSFRLSDAVDCMTGFFSSDALATLAPGLATFINESDGLLRLIVSPYLSADDQAAIDEGLRSEDDVASEVLSRLIITEDALQQHTLKCLAHLVRIGRIELRIALMKSALFHPKVWMFRRQEHTLAAHGSSNVTVSGIRRNFEQITVSRSWANPTERYVVDKLQFQFQRLWDNKEDDCIVVSASAAVKDRLLQQYSGETPPSQKDFETLYRRALKAQRGDVEDGSAIRDEKKTVSFDVPSLLNYTDGPFAHQGDAVEAWVQSGYRGILEMATGAGKTIAAMVGAYRLWQQRRPLLLVVAAPYVPLMQQWCDEISAFGLSPINMTELGGADDRAQVLQRARRRLKLGQSNVEAIVVSHDTLTTQPFLESLRSFECTRLLIADEVHNLGRSSFIDSPPEFFECRLGLSATPVRQYDDTGTQRLIKFFGPIVFRFALDAAIGRCLVEYDYYVHLVELTPTEMDRWYELTDRIRQNAWRQDEHGEPDDYLSKLFRDRREILETADGKIGSLDAALGHEDLRALKHTLIYTSDKAPEQLEAVNRLLRNHGVLFHQLTAEETADRAKTARILAAFRSGEIQVLTAKRVLDEGVNIPEISRAYVLASTTVERQWIQRRGRLLRTCPRIGKTHSVIHDFVAVPPEQSGVVDADTRKLVQSELRRVQAFARLARNAGRPDGALSTIAQLVDAAYVDA